MPDGLRAQFYQSLRAKFELLVEEHQTSRMGAAEPIFVRLGLTDAIIARIALRRYLVLTDDFPLSNYLVAIEADVINFNHLRFGMP